MVEAELSAEEDDDRLESVAGGDFEDVVLHDRGGTYGFETDDD